MYISRNRQYTYNKLENNIEKRFRHYVIFFFFEMFEKTYFKHFYGHLTTFFYNFLKMFQCFYVKNVYNNIKYINIYIY